MPRKFCFILPEFHLEFTGGAETQCYFIAQELLKRGWEVHYIRESRETGSRCVDGIHLHSVPRRRKLFKWRNFFELRRVMRIVGADFWYARADTSYLPLLVWHARSVGGKTIWAFSRDTQLSYDNKRVEGRHAHNLVARLDQAAFFLALRRTDRILLQTEKQRETLRRETNLSGEVIYNAHPLPIPPSGERKQLVLWIGRLQTFKHPERFLELARCLQHTSMEFCMVGDTENMERRQSLKHQAEQLANVRMLGRLAPDQVHGLLASAMLLVNTSDYEGFSNTFIEAWLRGVPVLSLHVDPDQFIARERLGIVESDLRKAADKLMTLISDHDAWRRMSARCIDFAHGRFGIAKAIDRLESSIASL